MTKHDFAILCDLEDRKPLSEVDHSSRPVGSKIALTNTSCDNCEESGAVDISMIEAKESYEEDYDIMVPILCYSCFIEGDYKEIDEFTEEEITEEV